MVYSKIKGVGVYLPKSYSNEEFIKLTGIDSSDEWITRRTGIKTRTLATHNESNATMAIEASRFAIKEANIKEKDTKKLGLIIAATNTTCGSSNSVAGFPCTAGEIQVGLDGLVEDNCGFFDLQAGCTGINYALAIADSLIRSEMYQKILVIGTDKLSDIVDYRRRETSVLLSDGALAYVLVASTKKGFVGHRLYGNGKLRNLITSQLEERMPFMGNIPIRSPTINLQGKAVYKNVVSLLEDIIINFEQDNVVNPEGISFMDIKAINPHQSNKRMIDEASERIAKRLYSKYLISKEEVLKKFEITIDRHGNNSTASPGPGFRNLRNSLNQGDHILMIGMGAGFTWALNHYII